MIYTDYDYYSRQYGGGNIPERMFPRFAREASAYIDRLTFQRLDNKPEIPERVKMAVCAVSEVLYNQHREDEKRSVGVASESVDGYSISFAVPSAPEVEQVWKKKKQQAAGIYLPSSDPLRYAGF